MGKPLVNSKHWTRNDKRMMIIVQLVLVYPVLAGSLFMVLLFFVLPRDTIWPHAFWVIASGAWVLLLSIILPLMRDKHDYYEPTADSEQTQPLNKPNNNGSTEKIPQVHVRVEAAKMDRINRDSILTNRSSNKSDKSEDRSSDGLEKGTLEEKADKEKPEKLQGSVNNSRENMQKSMDSICNNATLNKRNTMTQSGEFLNECTVTFGDDNKNQDNDDVLDDDNKNQNKDVIGDDNKIEVNADVHHENNTINDKKRNSNEKESEDDDSEIETINETQDMIGKIEEGKNHKGRPEVVNDNKSNTEDSHTTDNNTENDKGRPDVVNDNKSNTEDSQTTDNNTENDKGRPDVVNVKKSNTEDSQNTDSNTENIKSQMHPTEVVSPAPLNVFDKQLCQADTIDDYEEEFGDLGEEVSTPPPAASLDRRNSNVVHLFIKGN